MFSITVLFLSYCIIIGPCKGSLAYPVNSSITDDKESSINLTQAARDKERPYNKKDDPLKRKINTFRTGDVFRIGLLEVEPIHVDHSVPGAYGFIIYTSAGPIGYTGDIRLHGTVPQMTTDFIEKAKSEKLIALIMEGTRIADDMREESEGLVSKESKKIVSTTNRLVLADFNFKDVDRLRTCCQLVVGHFGINEILS
jgi:mRNA degradation ribonuclease J1/J2